MTIPSHASFLNTHKPLEDSKEDVIAIKPRNTISPENHLLLFITIHYMSSNFKEKVVFNYSFRAKCGLNIC